MKRFTRKRPLDRHGVVRTNIVLGAVLLLVVVVILMIFTDMDTSTARARVAESVERLSAYLSRNMEDGFETMSAVAETDATTEGKLAALVSGGLFKNACIAEDGASAFAKDGGGMTAASKYRQIGRGKSVSANAAGILLKLDANGSTVTALMTYDTLNARVTEAFGKDIRYAVYDVASGSYLIDRLEIGGTDYFETLNILNGKGEMTPLRRSSKAQAEHGGDVFAQTRARVMPWGVTLRVSHASLEGGERDYNGLIILIAAACLLIAFVIDTFLEIRRIRRVEAETKTQTVVLTELARRSAVDAGLALFVFDREKNDIPYYTNHLNLLRDVPGIKQPRSLDDLERACGIDEAELGRLADRIYGIEEGQVGELMLHASSLTRDGVLRFEFNAVPGHSAYVLCCVTDGTQEDLAHESATDEANYRRGMLPKCASAWEIDVANNRWRRIHRAPGGTLALLDVPDESWRDYEGDLHGIIRDYLDPQDYHNFAADMCLESLMTIYRKGSRDGGTYDDRIRDDSTAGYHWNRRIVRVFKNPDTGSVWANFYILNIDAQKNAELERRERARYMQKALTALGGIFYGIYYVDLENDLCYSGRAYSSAPNTELCLRYSETVASAIESGVHPEDRAALKAMLDGYNIRKQMSERAHCFTRKFRSRQGEDYVESVLIIQAARFENAVVREFVVALEHTHKLRIDEPGR